VPLHIFGSTSTVTRFGECFRDGQHSLVSFLFAVLLTVPVPMQVKVRGGGARAPCPMESAPLLIILCFAICQAINIAYKASYLP